MNKIIEKASLSENIVKMVLESPVIAKKRKAGQFIILKINEKGERIPLTIVDSDVQKGTITIIFQIVGKTTAQLAALNVGDSLQDLQGPLGHPTEIAHYGRVVCIGGGVGVGVVYPVIVALKKAGNEVISIIGSRTKASLILEKEIRENSDRLIVTTDDGSYGIHGFVSSVFEQEVLDKGEHVDRVFTIGPVPMMVAVCKITKLHRIKTIVSLNSIMVDATGMCGACRVNVAGKTKFTCVDGPEFDGHDVDFDLLSDRLRMYCDMEREAYEKHKCGCDGN
ncbi:MAG: ferredoxin-NADP reductase [Deltaproteobacteria bacterium HGW-Deltaproteobacteria-13]|nr:MAG: ferredoxin-NADP reductase [Deltaproteobacteria bacterium HGW-Deltaproteobacteria-13]